MDKIQKLSETTFSRPAPDEIIDVELVAKLKENALVRLKIIQNEITQYDEILGQAKKIGVEVKDVEEVLVDPIIYEITKFK